MSQHKPVVLEPEQTPRKAFVPPKLERHRRLPQITGFSFGDDDWGGWELQ